MGAARGTDQVKRRLKLRRYGQDCCAQRQGQDHTGREGQRQGSRLPHLCQHDRARRCVEKDLERRPRLSLGQARRPELPGADLRLAGRGRRQGRLRAHLVPSQRRLTGAIALTPRSLERGVFLRFSCRTLAHSELVPRSKSSTPIGAWRSTQRRRCKKDTSICPVSNSIDGAMVSGKQDS